MDSNEFCREAVVHQNDLKEFLLSHLSRSDCLHRDTTISLADGQLFLNRIFLGLMFPGLSQLANFDGAADLVLCLPDFKRADLLRLLRRILALSRLPTSQNRESSDRELEIPQKSVQSTISASQPSQCSTDRIKLKDSSTVNDHGQNLVRAGFVDSNTAVLEKSPSQDEVGTVGSGPCEISSENEIDPPPVPQTEPIVPGGELAHRCVKKKKKSAQQQNLLCSVCAQGFENRRALSDHRRLLHRKHQEEERKRFPCRYCSGVYNRQDDLKVK